MHAYFTYKKTYLGILQEESRDVVDDVRNQIFGCFIIVTMITSFIVLVVVATIIPLLLYFT